MTDPTWASARDQWVNSLTAEGGAFDAEKCRGWDGEYAEFDIREAAMAGADFGRSWAESCHKKTPKIMTDRDDASDKYHAEKARQYPNTVCYAGHDFSAGWDACRASLVSELEAAEEGERVLREALRGVVAVADRNTKEFDAARAALALRDKGGGK